MVNKSDKSICISSKEELKELINKSEDGTMVTLSFEGERKLPLSDDKAIVRGDGEI